MNNPNVRDAAHRMRNTEIWHYYPLLTSIGKSSIHKNLQCSDSERTTEPWPSLRIRLQDTIPTHSAAAPCVAFPAEHLAAARGFGIVKDYLRAGEQKRTSPEYLWLAKRGPPGANDRGRLELR